MAVDSSVVANVGEWVRGKTIAAGPNKLVHLDDVYVALFAASYAME